MGDQGRDLVSVATARSAPAHPGADHLDEQFLWLSRPENADILIEIRTNS
jgi:hypothetical protein